MKKTLVAVTAVILSFNFVSSVFAQNGPMRKIYRGSVNIVTAPGEIPKEIRRHWIIGSEKTDHILIWIFCGFIKGTVETVKRTASGLWDMATFPFALPKDYQPILKPDYVFEEWPVREKKEIERK